MSTAEMIVENLLQPPTEAENEAMVQSLCTHFSGVFHTEVEPADFKGLSPAEVLALYYRHVIGMKLDDIGMRLTNEKNGGRVAKNSVSRRLQSGFRKLTKNLGTAATQHLRITPETFHVK